MSCRPGCAACCVVPSISSPLPGMPRGKLAGDPCPHLDADLSCRLYGRPERPAVCANLRPEPEMCGRNAGEAFALLRALERETRPDGLRARAVDPVGRQRDMTDGR